MTIRHTYLVTAGLIVALLFACAGLARPVTAIDGESIVMSPASKPIKVDAGQVVNDHVMIINDGTTGYTFKVYATPYSIKNSSYEGDFDSKVGNSDAYQWVTFEKTEYHLEPGQRVEVPYRVSVPNDAASGGHYGVIFAETQPMASQQSQIARKKRVGMIMYVTIKGDYVEAGREVGVRIDPIQIGYPLSGTMTVENTGNADFTMGKTLRIKSIFGGTLYESTLEHIILPKTTRDIALTWDKGAWIGWYNVTTESNILGKKMTHDQLVFIAPPWFMIVAVAVPGGVGYLVVRRFRRR